MRVGGGRERGGENRKNTRKNAVIVMISADRKQQRLALTLHYITRIEENALHESRIFIISVQRTMMQCNTM